MEDWKERTEMLVGERMLGHFADSAVAVIGVGGVGGYAAEMLVRAGIGHIYGHEVDKYAQRIRNRFLFLVFYNYFWTILNITGSSAP